MMTPVTDGFIPGGQPAVTYQNPIFTLSCISTTPFDR